MMRLVVLVVSVLLGMPRGLVAAQDTVAGDPDLAQRIYDEGLRAYEGGRFDEALERFTASFEITRSPNARLMVARCLRNLGRNAEALAEYEVTEREAIERARSEARFEPTRRAAAAEGSIVARAVGSVRISLVPAVRPVEVRIGERVLPRRAIDLPIPVDPGLVPVRVVARGYRTAEREIRVEAGETVEARLVLAPAASRPRRSPLELAGPAREPGTASDGGASVGTIVAVTGAAVAAVAVGAGIVLALMTQSRYDELAESPCPPGGCSPDAIAEGRAFATATYVSFSVAAAAAIAAILGLATSSGGEPSPEGAPLSARGLQLRW